MRECKCSILYGCEHSRANLSDENKILCFLRVAPLEPASFFAIWTYWVATFLNSFTSEVCWIIVCIRFVTTVRISLLVSRFFRCALFFGKMRYVWTLLMKSHQLSFIKTYCLKFVMNGQSIMHTWENLTFPVFLHGRPDIVPRIRRLSFRWSSGR